MNNTFDPKRFSRLVFEDTPIYVDPDGPDWFVPNAAGDRLLCGQVAEHGGSASDIAARQRFLAALPAPAPGGYNGRREHLTLSHLDECWLHITDHCNLACRHCLFSCSPRSRQALSLAQIGRVVAEVHEAGARTFYLTGGEPMMHPDFEAICRMIVADRPDTTLVILTNGMRLDNVTGLLSSLPAERVFLQISMDGMADAHDRIRGAGSFQRLSEALAGASHLKCHKTLAMAVTRDNAAQMHDAVGLAARYGISDIHFLWLFTAGNAGQADLTDPDRLFSNLKKAHAKAENAGVGIDNIKTMTGRVFSPVHTRHDLSNAGWRAVAVGPDGTVYPTAAMIGQPSAACGHIDAGIAHVWQNSPLLEEIRGLSVVGSKTLSADPLRFIIGGGDPDHCFYAAGSFIDGDPYLPLYRNMALWQIAREAKRLPAAANRPLIRLKMGDVVESCRMDGSGVALTRSNCVLSTTDAKTVAGDFYDTAAKNVNEEIANPVCYPESIMDHVPQNARIRSYGCGSPVLDANIRPDDTVVDLGAGAGLECFIAARRTGPGGTVFGIDMSDPMIALAHKHKKDVCRNLGYDNIRFKKGLLEQIPLPDNCADVVISNCVINLSENKRQTFAEILRILKPGGRIMIADVVCDRPVPARIAGNDKLRGECLAGAMVQPYLLLVLETAGFADIRLEKRFFYREADGHRFFSLTYSAGKPGSDARIETVYPGPFATVITDDGRILHRGVAGECRAINGNDPILPVITPDRQGNYADPETQNPCACTIGPSSTKEASKKTKSDITLSPGPEILRHSTGCMVCGNSLVYLDKDEPNTCRFCSGEFIANAVCRDGHFVCDTCHGTGVLEFVRRICVVTDQTDMMALAETIRAHPAFPVHGPEHHFMVPGVILAAFRNAGGIIADEAIINGIARGKAIPGGTCAFWGVCGAAAGAGIALGIILGANPLIADKRRIVSQAVAEMTKAIGETEAARCCRRETLTVLSKTAELSKTLLSVVLKAENAGDCSQVGRNKECITNACRFFKAQSIREGSWEGSRAQ